MARYIDADELKKKLGQIGCIADDLYGMGINRGIDRAETAIDMMPTAEVFEVERCKNCTSYHRAAEVAMEIFEEIEKIITEPFTVGFDLLSPLNQALREYNNGVRKELLYYVAELKKKYTEGQT